MQAISGDRTGKSLILILVALTIARLVFASAIELTEDETYYRLWGLYPSYAYFDHAPMVGWWIAIGQSLFGDNAFGLRALSPLSAFIGSLLIWRIALISFNRSVADLAVILFNAMPLVGIGGVMMTPDVPSVFFWGMALWTLVEWTQSRNNNWWLAFGFAAGLGLLSKYTNVFLGVGVLLWLIGSGRWREAIRTPHFYLAGLFAVLLFSPVIYWNYLNEWASFSKQFGRLQQDTFTMRYLVEWIGGQILLMSPVIFISAIIFLSQTELSRNKSSEAVGLTIISTLPLIIYFLINSFSSRINANWTAPLYSNLAIIAAAGVYHVSTKTSVLSRPIAYSAAPLGFVMTIIILIEAVYPVLPADKRNPLSQLRGFEDFSSDVKILAQNMQVKTIVTSRYQLTGQLSYHLRDLSIVQMTERVRFLNIPQPDMDQFKDDVLYIASERQARETIEKLKSCIQKAEYLQSLLRFDRGTVISHYQVWKIEGLNTRLLTHGRPEDCNAGY